MIEIDLKKCCCTCKQTKDVSEFHKNRSTKDGFHFACKICVKTHQRTEEGKATKKRYEKSEKCKATRRRYSKRINAKFPELAKARNAVNNAVAAGKLQRPNLFLCHYCPKPAQQYHHWKGYTKEVRLDVVPACKGCHKKVG